MKKIQNREEYNARARDYKKKRRDKLRADGMSHLGGKCVQCGTTDNLQIDHIDPTQKSVEISQVHDFSTKVFWEEIKKCQLLCVDCHRLKTIEQMGHKVAVGTHGTLSSYRYCKCDLCKKAKSDYMQEYYKTHTRKRDRK